MNSFYQVSEVELIYKSKVNPSDRPQITSSRNSYDVLFTELASILGVGMYARVKGNLFDLTKEGGALSQKNYTLARMGDPCRCSCFEYSFVLKKREIVTSMDLEKGRVTS